MSKSYISGMSAWKKIWRDNKYAKKGISFENFQLIANQNCFYCGDEPRLFNPFGPNYETYKISHPNSTESWWLAQWITANGIDKIIPIGDYSDLTNLVPCCKICNFMKGLFGQKVFLDQIDKIHNHQHRITK